MISDEELERRAEAYVTLRDSYWIAVNKRNPLNTSGKLHYSPTRPAPTVPAANGPLMTMAGYAHPARDFPNDDYEWGHPPFAWFLRDKA